MTKKKGGKGGKGKGGKDDDDGFDYGIQPDLFGTDPHFLHRKDDPDTSESAA